MKLLFDMNLSPLLVDMMNNCGWESIHWASVGDPKATDRAIMEWGLKNGCCVVTNDLDFGDILAVTDAGGQVSYNSELRICRLLILNLSFLLY